VMRTATSICYVSFDFRGGIFTQISSELSQEDLAEVGFDLGNWDMAEGGLTGGMPLTAKEHSTMCAPPLRGVKSGTYRVLNNTWPILVELTTTEGFVELQNEEGFWFSDAAYGAPLPGRKAHLSLDITQCPFLLMTYTLPESIYYLGFDPVFKPDWAKGYTYRSVGELGPGFYADMGRSASWQSTYADNMATTVENPILGFSRTRETMAGYVRMGTSLTSACAPSYLDHIQCRFRYQTSAHALGLQQYQLQIFACEEAEPDHPSAEAKGMHQSPLFLPKSGPRRRSTSSTATRLPSGRRRILRTQSRAPDPSDASISRQERSITVIPGAATEDWIHGGRGVQFRQAGVEVFNDATDSAANWWSNARVLAMYRGAGQPTREQIQIIQGSAHAIRAPYLDFQGLQISCNRTTLSVQANQTHNGTDFTLVVGTKMPSNMEHQFTRCTGIDSRTSCLIEISFYECQAEFYCEGFTQHPEQMRQWCKCPPGTRSDTGFGPCSPCPQSLVTCSSDLGQTSCLPCPICEEGAGLSIETWNPAKDGFCRCPLGYAGLTPTPPGNSFRGQALGPCQICDYGSIQPTIGSATCERCPASPLITETTRYTNNPTWDWQKQHVQFTLQDGSTGTKMEDSCIDIMVSVMPAKTLPFTPPRLFAHSS